MLAISVDGYKGSLPKAEEVCRRLLDGTDDAACPPP
jgi:hypothetical protein